MRKGRLLVAHAEFCSKPVGQHPLDVTRDGAFFLRLLLDEPRDVEIEMKFLRFVFVVATADVRPKRLYLLYLADGHVVPEEPSRRQDAVFSGFGRVPQA